MFRYSKPCSCAFRQNFPVVLIFQFVRLAEYKPSWLHPWRLTWNIIKEVWFRSFSFLNGWFVLICRFQPLNLPGCNLRLNHRADAFPASVNTPDRTAMARFGGGRCHSISGITSTPPGNYHILLMVQKSRVHQLSLDSDWIVKCTRIQKHLTHYGSSGIWNASAPQCCRSHCIEILCASFDGIKSFW